MSVTKRTTLKPYSIFFIIFVIYLFAIFLRPYELDESLYMLTGKMIIQGRLNPLTSHYSNPFTYIFGTPLPPLIYGSAYIIGGIYFARFFSLFFVFSSVILAYKIALKIFGYKSARLSLIVAGLSNSVVFLASDALLDSIGIFFLMLTLFLIYNKVGFSAGFAGALAVLCKFSLILPLTGLTIYFMYKRMEWKSFVLGQMIVFVPFALIYYPVIGPLLKFYNSNFMAIDFYHNLYLLIINLLFYIPVAFVIPFLYLKNRVLRNNIVLFIPTLAISGFHFLTMNATSWGHQIPYALVPASVLTGGLIQNYPRKTISVFIVLFVLVNLVTLRTLLSPLFYAENRYIGLNELDGKFLSVNPFVTHLIRNTDLRNDYVYSYFWFDYDNDGKSDLKDYENALREKFFDYALVPSDASTSKDWPRYMAIEGLVRKYYCHSEFVLEEWKEVAVYRKCSA